MIKMVLTFIISALVELLIALSIFWNFGYLRAASILSAFLLIVIAVILLLVDMIWGPFR